MTDSISKTGCVNWPTLEALHNRGGPDFWNWVCKELLLFVAIWLHDSECWKNVSILGLSLGVIPGLSPGLSLGAVLGLCLGVLLGLLLGALLGLSLGLMLGCSVGILEWDDVMFRIAANWMSFSSSVIAGVNSTCPHDVCVIFASVCDAISCV